MTNTLDGNIVDRSMKDSGKPANVACNKRFELYHLGLSCDLFVQASCLVLFCVRTVLHAVSLVQYSTVGLLTWCYPC